MQIRIGQKIRELRRRDGRTQETMAQAIGVSGQAVSRWESGAGYPDMEIIPAIANYFHVTIDTLFDYSEDREQKLRDILDRADGALNEQTRMTEIILCLREAIREFPNEPKLLIRLGYALSLHGWQIRGARCETRDGSDYIYNDTEYNSRNIHWQEATQIFERVLTMEIPTDDRKTILSMMVSTYANMGQSDRAIALAERQSPLSASRELLLVASSDGELRHRYQGEAFIALFAAMKQVITIQPRDPAILLALAQLGEAVFADGRCGACHAQLCELYLYAALDTAVYAHDLDAAMAYFARGYAHKAELDRVRGEGDYAYSAPLVSHVTVPQSSIIGCAENFWAIWRKLFPTALLERIRADARFSACFH